MKNYVLLIFLLIGIACGKDEAVAPGTTTTTATIIRNPCPWYDTLPEITYWDVEAIEIPLSSSNIAKFYFANESLGFALADNGLFTTTDFGTTWEEVTTSLPAEVYTINYFHFEDRENGIIVAPWNEASLDVFTTRDGGVSWEERRTPMKGRLQQFATTPQGDWVAVFKTGEATSQIFKSEDNGASWTLLYDTEFLFYTFVLKGDNIYLVDKENVLHVSKDNGESWTERILPTDIQIDSDVVFFSDGLGYISSADGLFKTTNAGESWEPIVRVDVRLLAVQEDYILALQPDFACPGGDVIRSDKIVMSSNDGGKTFYKSTPYSNLILKGEWYANFEYEGKGLLYNLYPSLGLHRFTTQ